MILQWTNEVTLELHSTCVLIRNNNGNDQCGRGWDAGEMFEFKLRKAAIIAINKTDLGQLMFVDTVFFCKLRVITLP